MVYLAGGLEPEGQPLEHNSKRLASPAPSLCKAPRKTLPGGRVTSKVGALDHTCARFDLATCTPTCRGTCRGISTHALVKVEIAKYGAFATAVVFPPRVDM